MKKFIITLAAAFATASAVCQTFPVNNLQVNGNSTFAGTLSGPGITALFASPSGIGTVAPNTGSFTNLTATGTVSGVGFDNYLTAQFPSKLTAALASPPAIGSTTPNAGFFTTLSATTANPSFNYLATGTGAVARSYASKFNDVVSIKDFGADGTGIADSTSAIQSAITYILSLPNGGAVYMPAGTYKVTGQINVPNAAGVSIKLYGDGAGTRIKYTGSATTNIFFLGSSTPTFGSFYDLESFGFLAPSAGSITAIYMKNINSSLIYNVDVLSNTNALILEASFNTRVIGVDFNSQNQYGISTNVTGTNSLIVENSVISNAGVSAINLAVGGNNIVIRDNDLEANAITMSMTNYTSVLYEGNYAENNTNVFFSFAGTNNAVDIRQNWLGANGNNTSISNITGGSFVNNTLFNSTFTYANTFDMDSGGNVLTGSAALAVTPFQTSIGLVNTWSAATHTVGYKKSTNGMVEIRGNMTAGASSNGNIAFNLPAIYRPSQQKVFAVYNQSTGGVASCIVDTNGNVVPSGVANGNVLNLDGLMYNAGN